MKRLTYRELQTIKPNSIFRSGANKFGRKWIEAFPDSSPFFNWVAVRGTIDDWAIYYGSITQADAYIAKYGTKIHGNGAIKWLVPCTNKAFKRYRH